MNDVLDERFAALTDPTDDGDWLDVRRRARRPRGRLLLAAAAVVAGLAAVTALAATGGWIFSRSGSQVTGVTHVSFHGRTWAVSVSTGGDSRFCRYSDQACTGGFCAKLTGPRTVSTCGIYLVPLPTVPRKHVASWLVLRRAFPFGALRLRDGGGEIWFGEARADVTRIVLTDGRGGAFTAQTVQAPSRLRTTTRFWAVPLPASYARTIAAYSASGALVKRAKVSRLYWIKR